MSPHRLALLDPRVPDWGADSLHERSCPICGSAIGEIRFNRPDGLGVKQCSTCHTHFVSPAPDNQRLARFYAEYDSHHRAASALRPEDARRIFNGLEPLADVRINELLSLGNVKGKDVLDVGFGRGQFLYLLKRLGARPHGLELDPAALGFARQLGMEDVHLGTLEDSGWVDRFDLVVLNDVIEHPLQPLSLLRAAARSLRPGGHVLVWTPNGEACLHEREPVTFRVDLEHMQYLAPASVVYLATALELDVVHLETLGGPALEQFTLQRGHSLGITSHLKRLARRALSTRLKTAATKALRLHRPLISESRLGRYHLFFILRKRGSD
jgi:2-polyprenyl-3-methyl-5-hydroxy-6-metoxy-1,4-benzoquinol methylase